MIQTILEHRSIREYKSDQIPSDVLSKILECGARASTTGNMQVYSMIVTKDQVMKEALCKLHFGQQMVNQAPVVITFCADFYRFSKWCQLSKAKPGYDNFLSFLTAGIDALLAAQNVALAAESEGLGICYLGTTTYNAPEIIELLELPELVVPITTLVIGYPNESPDLTDRLPIASVVHDEKYKRFTDEEIKALYYEKENSDFTKQLLELNKKETLAQIFTDNRYTKKDNEAFSEKILSALAKQGFIKAQ